MFLGKYLFSEKWHLPQEYTLYSIDFVALLHRLHGNPATDDTTENPGK
jgi:hypothetical protein